MAVQPEGDAEGGGGGEIVAYTCGHGARHAVPGGSVRVLAWGATGFEVACSCGPEPLSAADEPPHESTDHLASIDGWAPSPSEWLALERVRDGWYDEDPWQPVESEGKTPMELRAEIREGIDELAEANERNAGGGADEVDRAARAVECPQCDAASGRKCQRPSGHRVRRSHAARKDAADLEGDDSEGDGVEQASLSAW